MSRPVTATFWHPYPVYQWEYKQSGDWADIEGYAIYDDTSNSAQTDTVHLKDDAVEGNEGKIRCRATGPDGQVEYSDEVTITVGALEWDPDLPLNGSKTVEQTPEPISIDQHPDPIGEITVGNVAAFSIVASHPAGRPLFYQWQVYVNSTWTDIGAEFTTVTGETTDSGTITPELAELGAWTLSCRVRRDSADNTDGEVRSDTTTMTVVESAAFTYHFADFSTGAGDYSHTRASAATAPNASSVLTRYASGAPAIHSGLGIQIEPSYTNNTKGNDDIINLTEWITYDSDADITYSATDDPTGGNGALRIQYAKTASGGNSIWARSDNTGIIANDPFTPMWWVRVPSGSQINLFSIRHPNGVSAGRFSVDYDGIPPDEWHLVYPGAPYTEGPTAPFIAAGSFCSTLIYLATTGANGFVDLWAPTHDQGLTAPRGSIYPYTGTGKGTRQPVDLSQDLSSLTGAPSPATNDFSFQFGIQLLQDATAADVYVGCLYAPGGAERFIVKSSGTSLQLIARRSSSDTVLGTVVLSGSEALTGGGINCRGRFSSTAGFRCWVNTHEVNNADTAGFAGLTRVRMGGQDDSTTLLGYSIAQVSRLVDGVEDDAVIEAWDLEDSGGGPGPGPVYPDPPDSTWVAPDNGYGSNGDTANPGAWGWTQFWTPNAENVRTFEDGPTNPSPYTTIGLINPTKDTIGGWWNYSNTFTTGDYIVNSQAELVSAISAASPGDTIYIASSFTVTSQMTVSKAINIVGNRGVDNGEGPTLTYSYSGSSRVFYITVPGVRLAGFRVVYTGNQAVGVHTVAIQLYGAGGEYDTNDYVEFENMHFEGMTYAGIYVGSDSTAYVHHCNFEKLTGPEQTGLNYGVAVYQGARFLAEANRHDGNSRHLFACDGRLNNSYEARFNYVYQPPDEIPSQHHFDAHDNPDIGVVSGNEYYWHHNTLKNIGPSAGSGNHTGAAVRGDPNVGAWIDYNIFASNKSHSVIQYVGGRPANRRAPPWTYGGAYEFYRVRCELSQNTFVDS